MTIGLIRLAEDEGRTGMKLSNRCRLKLELVAGKHIVTLRAIEIRELCSKSRNGL
jgi:hypothetical protein